jgi:outer membrane protein assembly factor BamC
MFMVKINTPLSAMALAVCAALAGCSSVEGFLAGDKVDYKSQAVKTAPLEVPPDLTQLQRDGRYAAQAGGTVSASTFQGAATAGAPAAAATTTNVAPNAIGEMKIMRDGNQRWLVVPMAAEALWPQLRAFWQERGFSLVTDIPEAGVMETDWAENRAKIPQDGIRRALGRVFENFYDSGERDRFKTRVERSGAASTEVFITHRGMEEVLIGPQKDQTIWRPRASDAQLEAEFLQRLMVKLGTKEDQAKQALASPTAAPTAAAAPRAQALAGQTALRVDEPFDRAWRRVGIALDRNGFTVEDRNRTDGIYFVRYADPKTASQSEPGFFAKLFGGGAGATAPARYRVLVKGDGAQTTVSVQDGQGAAVAKDIGDRIVSLLVDDLK